MHARVAALRAREATRNPEPRGYREYDMTKHDETLTPADARAWFKRFPAQGKLPVILNMFAALIGNAIVFTLVINGYLRAAHLIVLVAAETVLLLVMGRMQLLAVPEKDWPEQPRPWSERWPVLAFAVFWVCGAYSITLLMINGWSDLLALFHARQAWIDANLHIPIAFTVLVALSQWLADQGHYQRAGGPFVSSILPEGLARLLTLIFGAIPFAMPFFAVTFGGFKAVEYIVKKAPQDPALSVLTSLAMLLVAYLGFFLIGVLITHGVAGWLIGFLFAKLMAEMAVAAIPLVMTEVAAGSKDTTDGRKFG